jgi:hypothetical protein
MSVGRNDPCPCGSGKKYKRCCLGTARPPPRATLQLTDVSASEAVAAMAEGVMPAGFAAQHPCEDCGGPVAPISCLEVAALDGRAVPTCDGVPHWHTRCGSCGEIFDTLY